MASLQGNKQFQYTYCPISEEVKAKFQLIEHNMRKNFS